MQGVSVEYRIGECPGAFNGNCSGRSSFR